MSYPLSVRLTGTSLWAISSLWHLLAALISLSVSSAHTTTENQIVAAVIGFIALIFVSFLSTIGNLLPFEWLTTVCEKVSFGERYYSFTYGLFDFSNVVFFLSAIVAFLFLTVRVLEKRRWG